ncbi:YegP family protein [Robiginitalea sp. SC105]|uniref:YegP family protein n=1 Tax=Robiginitalea sp. SC105 TaxID=2762332 RepID=UPI0016399886|nr:YegP family protein [Robiginitalea sp. SC105]MBC2840680.1 YegP family protein [Robiginitalea sp. SC105]
MLEYRKDPGGGYRFVVKSEQGHPLLESVSFPNREDARDQVRQLKPAALDPVSFERRTDHRGRFQFTLRTQGGRVVGHSQFYRSEAGMENGITNIRRRLADLDP